MDEALVEHSKNEIDHHHGDDKQEPEAFERALKLGGGPLKCEADRRRHADLFGRPADDLGRGAQARLRA